MAPLVMGHEVRLGALGAGASALAVTLRYPVRVMIAAGETPQETGVAGVLSRGEVAAFVSVHHLRSVRLYDRHAQATHEPWASAL